ncbi:hypothetical protein D3C84_885140 [compost metagenome]
MPVADVLERLRIVQYPVYAEVAYFCRHHAVLLHAADIVQRTILTNVENAGHRMFIGRMCVERQHRRLSEDVQLPLLAVSTRNRQREAYNVSRGRQLRSALFARLRKQRSLLSGRQLLHPQNDIRLRKLRLA